MKKIKLNRFYVGDCLKLMCRIPDGAIDMVITSPPYDNLRDYKGYDFDFKSIARALYRILKWGGDCCVGCR